MSGAHKLTKSLDQAVSSKRGILMEAFLKVGNEFVKNFMKTGW
jgi:hypothetical protein